MTIAKPLRWIFLSPHLDDAAFSCGGLIWELEQRDEQVEVWSIFAGDPPDRPLSVFAQQLHHRWEAGVRAVQTRREEDAAACVVLGAVYRHFDFPDCIYRLDDYGRAVIREEEDLFQPDYRGETQLVGQLRSLLGEALDEHDRLAVPFAIGEHIDHQLVRRAVAGLHPVLWYADYPYSAEDSELLFQWVQCPPVGDLPVITEKALQNWQEAAACYPSQLSTFWTDLGALRNAFERYWMQGKGILRESC